MNFRADPLLRSVIVTINNIHSFIIELLYKYKVKRNDMSDLLTGLNNEQAEAVRHKEGTLIILAGAGCGKTKVLTTRIANLVKNGGASVYEILAVTFTNKAAREMKERLVPIIGEEGVKRMWVGTFHGIAGRILRNDIDKYKSKDGHKLDKTFVIYDDGDMNTLLKNILKQLNMDEKVYPVKQIRTVISDAKNKMVNSYDFATRARSYRDEQYAKIYMEYQKQLSINNALDFDDMLLIACDLLKNNAEIREKYYKRFKHILVDEFQDTNLAQYNFIKAIYTNNDPMYKSEGRSLCTVGDIDQSIYSWRGADYKILLNMRVNFPDAQLVKLEQNYRSTDVILKAANAIIKNNIERTEKNLYSNLGTGEKIQIYDAVNEDDEAGYIINQIKKIRHDYKLNECCVLYRTNSQSRKIEEACMANSVPYKIFGGQKFYDRKEIKDIIAYLKFIYNTNDSQSLSRIINVPKRSIGETTFAKVREISAKTDIPAFDIILDIDNYDEFNSGTKTKLKNFANLILELSNYKNKMPIAEFITKIIEETGYITEIKETEDETTAETRIDNLQELINVAKEFVPTEDTTDPFGEFLTQVALVSDIDGFEEEDNSLTLMTLHSAKGLEFDVVFLAGLDEGIFPHSRSINGVGGNAVDSELEEERRLMYVGVTRARKLLFITHAERRKMWGNDQYYLPSRFISEIPLNLTNQTTDNFAPSKNSGSTFSTAAATLEKKKFNFKSKPQNTEFTANRTSFGKDFVAPQKRLSVPQKPTITQPKISTEEQIKRILEDNPYKRRIAEMAMNNPTETKTVNDTKTENFETGDRVFHSKFGLGHISEIKHIAGTTMYIIDFGKQGKKTVDADFADIKKF